MILDVWFIILCLHGRLCTMTPAEVEPGSGTVSFALNTWQLEITLQLRWVLLFCLCQNICCLSFRFVAAHRCFNYTLSITLFESLLFKSETRYIFSAWVKVEGDFRCCAVGGSVSTYMSTITRHLLFNSLNVGDVDDNVFLDLRPLTGQFLYRWTQNSKTTRWSPKERWVGQTSTFVCRITWSWRYTVRLTGYYWQRFHIIVDTSNSGYQQCK